MIGHRFLFVIFQTLSAVEKLGFIFLTLPCCLFYFTVYNDIHDFLAIVCTVCESKE